MFVEELEDKSKLVFAGYNLCFRLLQRVTLQDITLATGMR